ncbi:MAG: SBBP repeat-containing protein [Bacteroidia bacterium]|nr:SBBP repeat-containing protein [Bacteroidia bacterium]
MCRYRIMLIAASLGWAQEASMKKPVIGVDRALFIENKGQWHSDVLYLHQSSGLQVWITSWGLNITFWEMKKPFLPISPELPFWQQQEIQRKNSIILGHRVLVEHEGTNLRPSVEAKGKSAGYYNYFIGNDPSKYATYVGLYKEVLVKEAYPGIALRYYVDKGRLRYDYLVSPGADPHNIRFRIRGADRVEIRGQKLVFLTRFGEAELCELRAYQGARVVPAQFVKEGEYYRIALGDYDPHQTLIIDPLLYSTYIGGTGNDAGRDVAVDADGHAYVTGSTSSMDYDTKPGAFQLANEGLRDIFVTKLSPDGTDLVYSTYIGGTSDEAASAIAIDGNGQAYVTGGTFSNNYPIKSGAFQATKSGGMDAFVTKLNSTGTDLVYSTYLGGSDYDQAWDIAVDVSGQAYVTGSTSSSDYDTKPGAYQINKQGSGDAFVTKLNSTGSDLVYSTYIGGNGEDQGLGIAIDAAGNAYVTGYTLSSDYDTKPGAYQANKEGLSDVFVTKVNPTGSDLIYSTYIGGNGEDAGTGITIDRNGNAYVVGYTSSSDYDVTSSAFQRSNDGGRDAFVTKLDPMGGGLAYSTYVGGSADELGRGIAVDASGHAYITGVTSSNDYDVSTGAFQSTRGGRSDVFVTKLTPTGDNIVYSTYLGGSVDDEGWGIQVDGNGHVYVVGETNSSNYDVTSNVFQSTFSGGNCGNYDCPDVFVTKLNPVNQSSQIEESSPVFMWWRVYPNPTTGVFAIRLLPGRKGKFVISDAWGRNIAAYTLLEGEHYLNLLLPSGFYLVQEVESGTSQQLVVVE